MTIDIERLKQRCDHADGGDDPCDLVLDTQTVRELIAIAERHDALAAFAEDFCSAAAQASDVMDDADRDQCEARHRLDHFRYNLPQKSALSLAQRDARVAADAFRKAADDYQTNTTWRCVLLGLANKYDKIAAGGGHD